jgi:type IV pilus assembly protein PilN
MIRINLLAVERERTKRRAGGLPPAQKLTIACSLILLATALTIGWWFWSLRQESARIDEAILSAEQETQRLRSVLTQVQQFEGRRAQLQQRVTLIEQLRKGQTGPVHMLDDISRSVPEFLWLINLSQTGNDVTIEGRATTNTALAEFMTNLENSSSFRRPVDIKTNQLETVPQAGELVRFVIVAQIQTGDAAAPAGAAPGAPAAPPARR